MNELKENHNNVSAVKEPSKILFHESNDGISSKISMLLIDKGEEK